MPKRTSWDNNISLGWDWVHSVRRPLVGLLYQRRTMDNDECEAVGGMIGRGNRRTRRKPAPMPLCSPQIPHYNWNGTRTAMVESWRLTAWAMAQPGLVIGNNVNFRRSRLILVHISTPVWKQQLRHISSRHLVLYEIINPWRGIGTTRAVHQYVLYSRLWRRKQISMFAPKHIYCT
jgi:hypothetical protein